MKKFYYLILLAMLAFSWQGKAQCDYGVNGNDSWGDGWNGARIDIEVAGVVTNFTVASSSNSVTIPAYTGDLVTFTWVSGSFDNEISFTIYDLDGVTVLFTTVDASGDVSDAQEFLTISSSASTCAAPSCLTPSAGTTTSVALTEANLTWTAGGSETTWNLEYGTADFTQGAGTMVTRTTTNPYAVSSLSASTTYDFYVQADCGGDTSSWAGPYSFYTGHCTPSSTSSLVSIGDFTTTLGLANISNLNSGYTTGGYADMTALSVQSYETGVFGFNLTGASFTNGNSIWVDWNSDLVFDDATEKVYNTTSLSNGALSGSVTIPAGTANGDYRMRLGRVYNEPNPSDPCANVTYGEFEDYTINVIDEPLCPSPSAGTTSSVTVASANLTWTAGGSETTWNLEYGTADFIQGAGTMVTGTTTNPYAVSSLSSSTTYDFYVQADCEGDGTSDWAGPYSFTTLCAAITSYPFIETVESDSATIACWSSINGGDANGWGYYTTAHTGTRSFGIKYNSSAHDDYLISPQFTITDGVSDYLEFYSKNYSSSDSEDFDVLISTTGKAATDFTYTLAADVEPGSTTWEKFSYDLSAYEGETIYIAFHITTTYLYYVYIDDITVTNYPASTWSGATSATWNDATNWADGVVPDGTTDVWITGNSGYNPIISVDDVITANNVNIDSGYTLLIKKGGSLSAVNLVNNGTLTLNADKDSSASIMLSGTSTGEGDITYTRDIDTENWYLISSPVSGQDINDFATASGLAPLTGNNLGLAAFVGETNSWDYYESTDFDSGSFPLAEGYSLKLATAGEITFTGTMDVDNTVLSLTDYSNTGGSAYNLLGNPYPSYIAGDNAANETDNILTVNSELLTEMTIWVWDQSNNSGAGGYTQFNNTSSYHLAPGQAFWVEASAVSTVFEINTNMQSHQLTGAFYLNEIIRPEINLLMTDGSLTKDADIFYIDGTTTGFDNGYDSSIFGGSSNSFAIYTQAVSNSTGKKLGIQSLPNSDFENMIIPVGINAVSGTEITIAATSLDLPIGIDVYLEDRDNNTLTLLDDTSRFTTILSSDLNGVGRFYLHTSSGMLNNSDVNMESIIIFKSSENNLQIAGVQNGMANLKIYDMLGKQVLETSFEGNGTNNISLPSVQNGIYIVHLETETGILNRKIIL